MTLALYGKSRKRQFTLMFAAFMAVVLGAAAVFAAPPVPGSASNPGGNQECPAGTVELAKFNWSNGYVLEGANTGGIAIVAGADDKSVSWTSTSLVSNIVVKGGPDAVVETVNPAALSGSFTNANLPPVGQGNIPGISNIKFCGDEPAETGSITITKNADPADETPFEFGYGILSVGPIETFTLADPAGTHPSSKAYTGLEAGETYVFVERLDLMPAGWDLESIVCSGETSSLVTTHLDAQTLEITLAAGEDITCTFYNELAEPPQTTKTVQVTKTWSGADPSDDDKIAFSVTITPGGDTSAVTCNYDTVMAGDCVATMDEDESYEVKEILPAGWTTDLKWVVGALFNASCEPVQVDASFATVVAQADCTHDITNTKQTLEPDLPVVTFHKYVCEDYSNVPANTTDGSTSSQANDIGQPDQVASANATLGAEWPFGSNPIPNPPGAFPGCELADGWNFTIATNDNFSANATTTGNTSGGTVDIQLTQAQLDAALNGPNSLWVKENYRAGEGYGFAAVKCHTDHLHRDNLEWIDLSGNNFTLNPVCVAFNVAPEDPTTTVEAFKTWDGDVPAADLLTNFRVAIFPSVSDGITCEWDGSKLVALFTGTPCKVTIGVDETYTIIETGLPQGATGPLEYQEGSATTFSAATCEEDAAQRLAIVVNGAGCTHTITNSYQA